MPTFGDMLAVTNRFRERHGFAELRDLLQTIAGVNSRQTFRQNTMLRSLPRAAADGGLAMTMFKRDKHRDEMVQALLKFKRSHDQFAMKKLIQKATDGKASAISEIPPGLYTRVIAAAKSAPLTFKDVAAAVRGFAKKNGTVKTIALLKKFGLRFDFPDHAIKPQDFSKVIDILGRVCDDEDRQFEKDTRGDMIAAVDRFERRFGNIAMWQKFEQAGINLSFEVHDKEIPRAKYADIIRACHGIKKTKTRRYGWYYA